MALNKVVRLLNAVSAAAQSEMFDVNGMEYVTFAVITGASGAGDLKFYGAAAPAQPSLASSAALDNEYDQIGVFEVGAPLTVVTDVTLGADAVRLFRVPVGILTHVGVAISGAVAGTTTVRLLLAE